MVLKYKNSVGTNFIVVNGEHTMIEFAYSSQFTARKFIPIVYINFIEVTDSLSVLDNINHFYQKNDKRGDLQWQTNIMKMLLYTIEKCCKSYGDNAVFNTFNIVDDVNKSAMF